MTAAASGKTGPATLNGHYFFISQLDFCSLLALKQKAIRRSKPSTTMPVGRYHLDTSKAPVLCYANVDGGHNYIGHNYIGTTWTQARHQCCTMLMSMVAIKISSVAIAHGYRPHIHICPNRNGRPRQCHSLRLATLAVQASSIPLYILT